MRRRTATLAWALLAMTAGLPALSSAQERHALIVTGAPGGESFEATYATWEAALATILRDRLGFGEAQVTVLSGATTEARLQSTRENVRREVARLRSALGQHDLLLVVLIGHGNVDDGQAKFNLVGPDLTSTEWSELVRDLPGRLVLMNTTGGSFPFLGDLAAANRIVITATDSTAQRYDTVFPEQLIAALEDPAADLDKNGRVSVWELFARTSHGVTQHYERQGLLPTERALLDDNGDGTGIESGGEGMDGGLARATYLERDPAALTADPELAELLARRRALEEEAEQLKLRKPEMPAETWDREFERLMIELARVSRRIRSRS
ncbi:MAG TPA: hypothetical protein VF136_06190 [Methylomirabilota bacterium]